VTLNKDGSPHVSIVWVGLDGDEIVSAHLKLYKKLNWNATYTTLIVHFSQSLISYFEVPIQSPTCYHTVFVHRRKTSEPTKVKEFKSKIREADAILIATPEYNYSIPGVLNNAIDFASRPYGDNPFNDKPVAIMSASIGMLGGARAQYHLRQNKFDSNGKLIDDDTRRFLKGLLENLVIWTKRLRKQ
jgi:putative NADPH-quinone reductase